MKLFTDEQIQQLLANGERSMNDPDFDPWPVAKLFTPDGGCTWLVTEMDPEEPDILGVLADLGIGCCEYGTASLSELMALRGRLGLPVERDLYWKPQGPISTHRTANASSIACRGRARKPDE
jgi:hypothetical protein